MKRKFFFVILASLPLLLILVHFYRNSKLHLTRVLRIMPHYLLSERVTNSSEVSSRWIVNRNRPLSTSRSHRNVEVNSSRNIIPLNAVTLDASRSRRNKTWPIPLQKGMWIDFSTSESVTKPTNESTNSIIRNQAPQKTILMYTSYFGKRPWLFAVPSWDGKATDWKGRKYCPDSCRVTYDYNELNNSDAVVFNARDMPKPWHLGKLLQNKHHFQRWIFYNRENPINTLINLFPLRGMFNWTATYRLDSDIFQPDHYIHPLEDERPPPDRNYAQGKDRLVIWIVSNCHDTKYIRNRITRQLLKYISIDIYGDCQSMFGQSGHDCKPHTDDCLRTMKRYKFYLAFENGNCYHYVTEKYWQNALMNDIVPVVMGGAVLEEKLVVPRSYINILDFPNAETLSNHLKYLDKNNTAYNEYFWYKKYYKIFKPQFICRLCKKLYDKNEKPRVYDNLFSLYSRQTNCYINETYIRDVWLVENNG